MCYRRIIISHTKPCKNAYVCLNQVWTNGDGKMLLVSLVLFCCCWDDIFLRSVYFYKKIQMCPSKEKRRRSAAAVSVHSSWTTATSSVDPIMFLIRGIISPSPLIIMQCGRWNNAILKFQEKKEDSQEQTTHWFSIFQKYAKFCFSLMMITLMNCLVEYVYILCDVDLTGAKWKLHAFIFNMNIGAAVVFFSTRK